MTRSCKRMFAALLSAAFFCSFPNLHAQDTLTAAERKAALAGIWHAPAGMLYRADSLNKGGDTAGAERLLLRIDPYHFISDDRSPDGVDSLLLRLHFPASLRDAYRTVYTPVFSGPRSAAYRQFQAARAEDQKWRTAWEHCADSAGCAYFRSRTRAADSVNFPLLYRYVQEKGWPSLADGGLHAGTLAIHDHERHGYYISVLKGEVAAGRAPYSLLDLLMTWQSQSINQAALRKLLDTGRSQRYDISAALRFQLPGNLPTIKAFLKTHCPARVYYIFESADMSTSSMWFDAVRLAVDPVSKQDILQRINRIIPASCPQSRNPDLWWVQWMAATRTRLWLYVVY